MALNDKTLGQPKGLMAQREAAQEVAVNALSFLASDPERLVRFLAETGLSPATLREAATKRGFGAGVLSFLMAAESLLLAFAAHAQLDPRHVAAAHEILSPASDPDAEARPPR